VLRPLQAERPLDAVRGAETKVRSIPDIKWSIDKVKRWARKTGAEPTYQFGGSSSNPSNCFVQIDVRFSAMA